MEQFEKGPAVEKKTLKGLKNTLRAFSIFAAVVGATAETSHTAHAEELRASGMDIITDIYGEDYTAGILSGEIQITPADVVKIRTHWADVEPMTHAYRDSEEEELPMDTFDKTNQLTEYTLNGLEAVAKLQAELRIEQLKLGANAVLLQIETVKLNASLDSNEETQTKTADELQKDLNRIMEELLTLTADGE